MAVIENSLDKVDNCSDCCAFLFRNKLGCCGGNAMNDTGKICGLECLVQKPADIWEIMNFPGVEFGSCYFYVADQSVYGGKNHFGKLPQRVTPEYFREIDKGSTFVERLVLHLYPETAEPEEIDTYEMYVGSSCKMIVLICDTCFFELYCKDAGWLQKIMDNISRLPGARVEEKREGNDPRTVMYV